MEDKIIEFGKGIHREPSFGAPGELTDCVNLYSDGTEMKVMPRMQTEFTIPDDYTALYIHENGGAYKHLIVEKGSSLSYIDIMNYTQGATSYDTTTGNVGTISGTINDITTIGNVLVVATTNKMYYFLWTEGAYVDFSFDELEDLDIQFALDGSYEVESGNTVSISDIAAKDNEELYESVLSTGKIDKVECTSDNETKESVTWYEGSYYKSLKTFTPTYKKINYPNLDINKTYQINVEFKDFSEGQKKASILLALKFNKYQYPIFIGPVLTTEVGDGKTNTINRGITLTGWLSKLGINEEGATLDSIYVVRCVDDLDVWGSGTVYYDSQQCDCFFWLTTLTSAVAGYSYTLTRTDENISVFNGDISKFIHKNATKENKFMYPFFVRYALQLVDGTYIKPSSPILMLPSTTEAPTVYVDTELEGELYGQKSPTICAIAAKLQYKINNSTALETIQSHSAVISNIVIGVTTPIYTYKLSGNDDDYSKSLYCTDEETDSKSYVRISSQGTAYNAYSKSSLDKDVYKISGKRIILPTYSTKEFNDEMESACSAFRIISTIDISKLSAGDSFGDVPIDDGTLSALDGLATIDDNYISLKKYNAEALYSYNNRLAIGNLTETMFKGYAPQIMACFTTLKSGFYSNYVADIVITKNNHSYTVRKKSTGYGNNTVLMFFYYPDPDAKSATIYLDLSGSDKYAFRKRITLKKHPYLNGSYWFRGFGDSYNADQITFDWSKYTDLTASAVIPNKAIYTIINNPFVFDSVSASLIGNGSIGKLIANTKALSQGQFGQHPVYAFCSDGIWALSVGSDGTFTAVQPVSRDVCNNYSSITQTDNAIAFTTDKGLMFLDGSNVKQLCKHMENIDKSFEVESKLGGLTSVAEFDGLFINDDGQFVESLKTCKLVYDYKNSLLWVMPEPTKDKEGYYKYIKQYAISLATEEVFGYISPAVIDASASTGSASASSRHPIAAPKGHAYSEYFGPLSIIPSYPQSFMQMKRYDYDEGGNIQDKQPNAISTFECAETDQLCYGWLLTRPIAFDDAYTMKMLYDMKVEKMLTSTDSKVKVAVYVSNDRMNWARLKSLKARSYKWYRFAVFCTMNDFDRLTGMVCRIDNRRTDKIR